jgi:hypothetical protein
MNAEIQAKFNLNPQGFCFTRELLHSGVLTLRDITTNEFVEGLFNLYSDCLIYVGDSTNGSVSDHLITSLVWKRFEPFQETLNDTILFGFKILGSSVVEDFYVATHE